MEIKPVRELEGNRTELVYNNKIFKQNSVVRHFSVPKEKVDEFSKSFEKQQKRDPLIAWISTGIAALLGVFLGGKVAKKSILSWAGAVAGGIAFGLGAISLAGRQVYKNQQKLFEKYDVKEMFYLKDDSQNQIESQPAEQPEISLSKISAGA